MRLVVVLGSSVLVAFGAASGCGADPTDPVPTPTPTTITFVHHNDFHANLVEHRDLVRDPDADDGYRIEIRGGAARVATIIRDLRDSQPHTVVMNIGDTYHGGVEALYTNGNAVADVVDALAFDIGVPGNWDFAFGPDVSWVRYRGAEATPPMLANNAADARRPNFLNLAANLTVEADSTAGLPDFAARMLHDALAPSDEEPWLPPTETRTFDDVDVGFIGITSDFVPRMHPTMALGMEFLSGDTPEAAEAAYVALLEEHALALRDAGCEVVVVMSELSIHKDYRLANLVTPGLVDVFFSAHTHELTRVPLTSASGALVVEAGNDTYVGQMDILVDDGVVIDRRWTLHDVDASIAEDPEVAALVVAARAQRWGLFLRALRCSPTPWTASRTA